MRPPRLCLSFALVAAQALAASFDDRVEALFRPLVGECVALSPDGRRVAYTTHRGADLAIVIAEIEPPGPRRMVKVEAERDATAGGEEGRPPVRLRFLRWATNERLVYAPAERIVPLPPMVDAQGRAGPNPDGPTILSPIFAVDADGKERGAVVDASYFQETPAAARQSLADLLRTPQELAATRRESVRWRMPHLDILGFHPRDREQLIIRTRGAYSIPMQHLVDLRTGGVREFGGDWPVPPGEPHIYDWFRLKVVGERRTGARPAILWHDAELDQIQRELARKFPRRDVEPLAWSDNRARVLCRVTGGSDPGRVFVFQRTEDLVLELFRCAPWLGAASLHPTRFFEFTAPDGTRLSGCLTWPGPPRATPPPLVVAFPPGVPGRPPPAFDPEAQALADLGFAVARLNHRGAAAARAEVERGASDDAKAMVEWLAAHDPARAFDRARVGAIGRGFGGYLALRARQRHPAEFRCAAAIDASSDPNDDEAGDGKSRPGFAAAEALNQPELLLVAGEHGAAAARANIYRAIGKFLDLHLRDGAVAVDSTAEAR